MFRFRDSSRLGASEKGFAPAVSMTVFAIVRNFVVLDVGLRR